MNNRLSAAALVLSATSLVVAGLVFVRAEKLSQRQADRPYSDRRIPSANPKESNESVSEAHADTGNDRVGVPEIPVEIPQDEAFKNRIKEMVQSEYQRIRAQEKDAFTATVVQGFVARGFERLNRSTVERLGLAESVRAALSPILRDYQSACERMLQAMCLEEDPNRLAQLNQQFDAETNSFMQKAQVLLTVQQREMLRLNLPPLNLGTFPIKPLGKNE